MAVVTMTVCDICNAVGVPTEKFEISDGEKVRLDLCQEHSAPIREVLAQVKKGATKRAAAAPAGQGRGRGRAAKKVVSVEEIEKLKGGE